MSGTRGDTPLDSLDILEVPMRGVVNVGVSAFGETLVSLGVPVVQVAWQPPARGDEELAALLARMGS